MALQPINSIGRCLSFTSIALGAIYRGWQSVRTGFLVLRSELANGSERRQAKTPTWYSVNECHRNLRSKGCSMTASRAKATRIEVWSIERLIPWTLNPRTHSQVQVAQIAASIAEFGFNNPILVDTQAGIIAGHGRLMAARQMGLTEVPVIVLRPSRSEAQKRAYIIADNQLAFERRLGRRPS